MSGYILQEESLCHEHMPNYVTVFCLVFFFCSAGCLSDINRASPLEIPYLTLAEHCANDVKGV